MALIPVYGAVTYGDAPERLAAHTQAAGQQFVLLEPNGPQLTLIGDASALAQFAVGGDDLLVVNQILPASAIGDAQSLVDHAQGGNDSIVLFGGAEGSVSASGDALSMSDHARGGDDYIQLSNGSGAASGFGVGDAETMSGHAQGGDDTIYTLTGSSEVYGDAVLMTDHATGGADTVSGSGYLTGGVAAGDAETMSGHAVGGDDQLAPIHLDGGDYGYQTTLYGDAVTLADHAQGGDDRIVGDPSWSSTMYGDGRDLLDHTSGGNDTLVSSSADETMWGDAANVARGATTGADLFVFSPGNGHDQIMDFQPGKDHIELDGFGIGSFQALAAHLQDAPDGVLISFGANDIFLRQVTAVQLSANDFIFA